MSPSPDESDWRDEVAVDSGGKMRSLSVLDRQRGVGLESFREKKRLRPDIRTFGTNLPAREHAEGESSRVPSC